MDYAISRLTERQISDDYLATLNDSRYMQFSQHKNTSVSIQTQCEYLKGFDFNSNFLLAITDQRTSKLVATATLRLLPGTQLVNIGFLVLKNFAGQGLGKKILRELSAWTFGLFPMKNQQIGTRRENLGMQMVALSAGFCEVEELGSSDYIYFLKHMHPLPQLLEHNKCDFHIVCNDAGGALHLSALANAIMPNATVTLNGPAKEIFARNSPLISTLDITSALAVSKKILLGSGFYGGYESQILESRSLKDNFKVVLLDHWINYRQRFHPQFHNLPNAFLVTNPISEILANQIFVHQEVLRIPDFLLAEQRQSFLSEEPFVDSVLFILEPNALIGEGLKYQIGVFEEYLSVIIEYCREHKLAKVVLRNHPSGALNLNLNLSKVAVGIEICYSSSESLVGDLLRARAVFGFHSSALYASAMLGVETYSFFAGTGDHWTGHFPEILGVR